MRFRVRVSRLGFGLLTFILVTIGVMRPTILPHSSAASGTHHQFDDHSTTQTSLGVQIEKVDLIELNHFIDEDGREVFRQAIFYDWSKTERRFHTRGWRLMKSDRQLPQRHWKPERYECYWQENSIQRKVVAKHMRETWSQHDPERVNRTLLPEEQRVPLFAKRKWAEGERASQNR